MIKVNKDKITIKGDSRDIGAEFASLYYFLDTNYPELLGTVLDYIMSNPDPDTFIKDIEDVDED